MTDSKDKNKKWEEYIKELHGDKPQLEINPVSPPIMDEEIMAAIERLLNGKALSCDGISAELLKGISNENLKAFLKRTGEFPEDFIIHSSVHFWDLDTQFRCKDYKTISLLSHAS